MADSLTVPWGILTTGAQKQSHILSEPLLCRTWGLFASETLESQSDLSYCVVMFLGQNCENTILYLLSVLAGCSDGEMSLSLLYRLSY